MANDPAKSHRFHKGQFAATTMLWPMQMMTRTGFGDSALDLMLLATG